MKPTKISVLLLFVILTFFYACQHEENLSLAEGKISFSFPHTESNGSGRTKGDDDVAFVLLSIKDSKGKKQENIKLALFSSGPGYITESLNLQMGDYELTQFDVLDDADNII